MSNNSETAARTIDTKSDRDCDSVAELVMFRYSLLFRLCPHANHPKNKLNRNINT
jgi:hypothetical protein